MNLFLLIGCCILGYLILGLIWARSQAVRIQLEVNVWAKKLDRLPRDSRGYISSYESNHGRPWYAPHGHDLEARAFRHGLGHQAAWWPAFLAVAIWSASLNWTAKPVSKQREKVAGLRARADKLAEMLDGLPTEEDRRILTSVIEENRALAKELSI